MVSSLYFALPWEFWSLLEISGTGGRSCCHGIMAPRGFSFLYSFPGLDPKEKGNMANTTCNLHITYDVQQTTSLLLCRKGLAYNKSLGSLEYPSLPNTGLECYQSYIHTRCTRDMTYVCMLS